MQLSPLEATLQPRRRLFLVRRGEITFELFAEDSEANEETACLVCT